jgi:hypothetical protein
MLVTRFLVRSIDRTYDGFIDGLLRAARQERRFRTNQGRRKLMPDDKATAIFHSNRYTAQSACEHCGGIVRHESWCITVDRTVYYAYEIVADSSKLSVGDALILHALGVIWGANHCRCAGQERIVAEGRA